MLILLNLLSGVALLVWGSHIVRTGILRVLGADLRTALGRSTGSRLRAFGSGVLVTSLVQSSNATAVIVTSFAAQGLLPLTSGLAIMLGADVGTALMARVLTLDLSWLSPILVLMGVPLFLTRKQTRIGQAGRTAIGLGLILLALSGTLAQNAAARRLALGSLVFKLAGALLILPFASLLARGLPVLIGNPREAVVGFHLIYNTLRCCACLALIDPVARICSRLLPDVPAQNGEFRALHLDAAALSTPSLALANAAREVLRIGDIVGTMLGNVAELIHHNNLAKARETARMDDDVDQLYAAVKGYLARISREQLDEVESRRWTDIIALTINLEHAGDIIERIVGDIEEKKIAHRLSFSEEGLGELEDLHARLVSNLQLGLSVFLNNDLRCAERLLAEKERFRDLERLYSYAHLDRLAGQTLRSIETSALHLDMISDMKRLNSLFCSTAYPVLDAAGALHDTRLRKRVLDTLHAPE